jgi:hypothetical protein
MTDRRRVKWLMKVWIAVGAVVIVVGYGAFRAKDLAEGPRLEIVSPTNGFSSHDALIDIRGTVQNISFLTLNGNKIFTNEAGTYDEKILLSPGYNIVTLEAKDRFGRTVTKELQLTYR